MKPLRVAEDIVPIGEFKGHAARWLKHVAENQQPVIITQNGKPAGVLIAPRDYDRLMERQRFLELVAAGLADADAGRVMDTAALKARLAARRSPGGR
jgi:prevent-host-death family protein